MHKVNIYYPFIVTPWELLGKVTLTSPTRLLNSWEKKSVRSIFIESCEGVRVPLPQVGSSTRYLHLLTRTHWILICDPCSWWHGDWVLTALLPKKYKGWLMCCVGDNTRDGELLLHWHGPELHEFVRTHDVWVFPLTAVVLWMSKNQPVVIWGFK